MKVVLELSKSKGRKTFEVCTRKSLDCHEVLVVEIWVLNMNAHKEKRRVGEERIYLLRESYLIKT